MWNCYRHFKIYSGQRRDRNWNKIAEERALEINLSNRETSLTILQRLCFSLVVEVIHWCTHYLFGFHGKSILSCHQMCESSQLFHWWVYGSRKFSCVCDVLFLCMWRFVSVYDHRTHRFINCRTPIHVCPARLWQMYHRKKEDYSHTMTSNYVMFEVPSWIHFLLPYPLLTPPPHTHTHNTQTLSLSPFSLSFSVCLSVYLSLCLCLSVCLFVCLSVCLSLHAHTQKLSLSSHQSNIMLSLSTNKSPVQCTFIQPDWVWFSCFSSPIVHQPARSRDVQRRRTAVVSYDPVQAAQTLEYDDLGTMSDLELPSFQRGGFMRTSLPIVRSASTSLERPLGEILSLLNLYIIKHWEIIRNCGAGTSLFSLKESWIESNAKSVRTLLYHLDKDLFKMRCISFRTELHIHVLKLHGTVNLWNNAHQECHNRLGSILLDITRPFPIRKAYIFLCVIYYYVFFHVKVERQYCALNNKIFIITELIITL